MDIFKYTSEFDYYLKNMNEEFNKNNYKKLFYIINQLYQINFDLFKNSNENLKKYNKTIFNFIKNKINILIFNRNYDLMKRYLTFLKRVWKKNEKILHIKIYIFLMNSYFIYYKKFKNYNKAKLYINEAYKKTNEKKVYNLLGEIYLNFGILNYHLKIYDKSLEFFSKSKIEISNKIIIKSRKSIQMLYFNYALLFYYSGLVYKKLKKLDQSKNDFEICLKILKENKISDNYLNKKLNKHYFINKKKKTVKKNFNIKNLNHKTINTKCQDKYLYLKKNNIINDIYKEDKKIWDKPVISLLNNDKINDERQFKLNRVNFLNNLNNFINISELNNNYKDKTLLLENKLNKIKNEKLEKIKELELKKYSEEQRLKKLMEDEDKINIFRNKKILEVKNFIIIINKVKFIEYYVLKYLNSIKLILYSNIILIRIKCFKYINYKIIFRAIRYENCIWIIAKKYNEETIQLNLLIDKYIINDKLLLKNFCLKKFDNLIIENNKIIIQDKLVSKIPENNLKIKKIKNNELTKIQYKPPHIIQTEKIARVKNIFKKMIIRKKFFKLIRDLRKKFIYKLKINNEYYIDIKDKNQYYEVNGINLIKNTILSPIIFQKDLYSKKDIISMLKNNLILSNDKLINQEFFARKALYLNKIIIIQKFFKRILSINWIKLKLNKQNYYIISRKYILLKNNLYLLILKKLFISNINKNYYEIHLYNICKEKKTFIERIFLLKKEYINNYIYCFNNCFINFDGNEPIIVLKKLNKPISNKFNKMITRLKDKLILKIRNLKFVVDNFNFNIGVFYSYFNQFIKLKIKNEKLNYDIIINLNLINFKFIDEQYIKDNFDFFITNNLYLSKDMLEFNYKNLKNVQKIISTNKNINKSSFSFIKFISNNNFSQSRNNSISKNLTVEILEKSYNEDDDKDLLENYKDSDFKKIFSNIKMLNKKSKKNKKSIIKNIKNCYNKGYFFSFKFIYLITKQFKIIIEDAINILCFWDKKLKSLIKIKEFIILFFNSYITNEDIEFIKRIFEEDKCYFDEIIISTEKVYSILDKFYFNDIKYNNIYKNIDNHNSGFISSVELFHYLKNFKDIKLNKIEILQFIKFIDIYENGIIDYNSWNYLFYNHYKTKIIKPIKLDINNKILNNFEKDLSVLPVLDCFRISKYLLNKPNNINEFFTIINFITSCTGKFKLNIMNFNDFKNYLDNFINK